MTWIVCNQANNWFVALCLFVFFVVNKLAYLKFS